MSDSENDGAGVPLIEDIADGEIAGLNGATKRKRDGDADTESKRAKKRKKTKKPKDVQDEALDTQAGVNHAIAHMDSRLLADHIAQRTRRFQPDLSPVEADDLQISERAIRDTSEWLSGRSLEKLPIFLDKYAAPRRKKKQGPFLSDAPDEKGTPHTLVVTESGIRAMDLRRALRQFQNKDAFIAKLFTKANKMKEAIESARKTRMNIGVGTPQRISDLIESGALSLDKLERIVIDASHIDQKKRGILDIPEVHGQLLKLLTRKDIKERYHLEDDSRIELIFF